VDDGGECELRCDNGIKFGELVLESGVLEVKCRSSRCGAGRGIIVIHAFDTGTGKLIGTEIFREPIPMKEEGH
jgi:hypothetical protein